MKKVSAGVIPLSEDTARRLKIETGVALTWLLGPADGRPVDGLGRLYTSETFQSYRSRRKGGVGDYMSVSVSTMHSFLPDICAAGAAAGTKGMAGLFNWRLSTFIDQATQEFGFDEVVKNEVAHMLHHSPMALWYFGDAGTGFGPAWIRTPECMERLITATNALPPASSPNFHNEVCRLAVAWTCAAAAISAVTSDAAARKAPKR